MASGKTVSVTDTATLLHQESGGVSGVVLHIANRGGGSVDLGDSGVTSGGGFELASGEMIDVRLSAGDALYGISASGVTNAVGVLVVGD